MTITKTELVTRVRLARREAGVTWADLAERLGTPPAWTVSALFGEQPLTSDQVATVGAVLDLDNDVLEMLRVGPYRGTGAQEIPTDPTIYRFYEALGVYGPAIKELIHEEFGDGIMSAINFRLTVERREDPAGDRVVVTFDGKFLDYAW